MHSLKDLCNDLLKNNTGLGAKKWSICASLKTQLCENCSTQLDVNTVFYQSKNTMANAKTRSGTRLALCVASSDKGR